VLEEVLVELELLVLELVELLVLELVEELVLELVDELVLELLEELVLELVEEEVVLVVDDVLVVVGREVDVEVVVGRVVVEDVLVAAGAEVDVEVVVVVVVVGQATPQQERFSFCVISGGGVTFAVITGELVRYWKSFSAVEVTGPAIVMPVLASRVIAPCGLPPWPREIN
jgi:hypothetical protein